MSPFSKMTIKLKSLHPNIYIYIFKICLKYYVLLKAYSQRHMFRAIVGFPKLGKTFVSFDTNELETSSFFIELTVHKT